MKILIVGQKVKANGYEGIIVEICEGALLGMVVVRLPGGKCCMSASYCEVI